jgi:hypothetical protein
MPLKEETMKNTWTKNFKKFYNSSYQRTKKDRVFTLVPVKGGKVYSFESWQAAVKAGFKKV